VQKPCSRDKLVNESTGYVPVYRIYAPNFGILKNDFEKLMGQDRKLA
jgi:hypothetical protein